MTGTPEYALRGEAALDRVLARWIAREPAKTAEFREYFAAKRPLLVKLGRAIAKRPGTPGQTFDEVARAGLAALRDAVLKHSPGEAERFSAWFADNDLWLMKLARGIAKDLASPASPAIVAIRLSAPRDVYVAGGIGRFAARCRLAPRGEDPWTKLVLSESTARESASARPQAPVDGGRKECLMTERQVHATIVAELYEFTMKPGGMKWPVHELLPALAGATGRMCALTDRTTADIDQLFQESEQRVTTDMRRHFLQEEPNELPLLDLKDTIELRDVLLQQAEQPRPFQKPSDVLWALVWVLAQLSALSGRLRAEILAIVEEARSQTPERLVREFQQAKNGQRTLQN